MGSLYGLKALSCSPPGTNKPWGLLALFSTMCCRNWKAMQNTKVNEGLNLFFPSEVLRGIKTLKTKLLTHI